ncbi:MAG: Flp pilus assembly complex ATPase component TadA [Rubrobacteridae bacterium]|nr:Flp pilus assembly complex ATPase component TadA [Rubrobacteridae bacterium]
MSQAAPNAANKIRLGDLLVDHGVITKAQLEEALFTQKKTGNRLGETLRELGFVSEETLIEFSAKQLFIPSVDLDKTGIDEDVVKLIPEAMSRKYGIIAIAKVEKLLTLAMHDPLDLFAVDDVRSLTGCQVVAVVATEKSIHKALDKYYWMQEAEEDADACNGHDKDTDMANADSDAARFIHMVLKQALVDKASDIHIEITETEVRVRIRVDGVLHQIASAPKMLHSAIISRLKILSELNIAEKRAPQDGRFSVRANGHQIDFRLSTVPTIFGEKAVMRILEKKAVCVEEDKLGFSKDELVKFRRLINSSYGMILVAGPTGSGKTTTLYTALNSLATIEKNIITIEDPVEYTFDMINQIQVNQKAGVTFASGLRAVLRQDPDVIMVGEIRDEETGDIAIHSALSGHLVLSTIHTNDAPSTPARFVEMGIQPFLVATATIGVIAQRLIRTLCPYCKEPYTPIPELLDDLELPQDQEYTFYKPKGCTECRGIGYKGRAAIFEILEIDNEIRDLITSKSPPAQIRQAATKQNFKTLRDSGIAKVVEGTTSLEIVMKATQDVS